MSGERCLCDTCLHGIWHANGDGYFCCTAPGMARISARTRKVIRAGQSPQYVCVFYERKEEAV